MILNMGKQARAAARSLAQASTEQKNQVLLDLAQGLQREEAAILEANQADIHEAHAAGLTPALIDRLTLNPARLKAMAQDLCHVAELPDPVGQVFEERILPNGLQVRKQRVPIGVIGVIYEARPNVTIDVAGLGLKTGNALILRGGSETLHSNRALTDVIAKALQSNSLPSRSVQFIDDPNRARVMELLNLQDYVDMLIPRGGAGLHQFCRENSRIPVITGGIGICHLFVDESANLEESVQVVTNAKVQRPTVCNALDTVLVHRAVASQFLPPMVAAMKARGVTFRTDLSALPYLPSDPAILPAAAEDFDTEWLSLVLGIKVVDDLETAMDHIRQHSTGHSDGILTANAAHAERFIREVDSAAVYVNASTRFTDGAQLGLGAEVAISTQRLHARGPMGLQELTTYKWVIQGQYHTRPD